MSNIKKIVIEVGGVELSLSPEDAKTLRDALNELFPTPARQLQFVPYSVPVPVHPRPWRWYEADWRVRLLSTTGNMGGPLGLNSSSINQLK
jgi:hypothetical protein